MSDAGFTTDVSVGTNTDASADGCARFDAGGRVDRRGVVD